MTKEEIAKIKIDLNKAASDIIVPGEKFLNLTTKQTAKNWEELICGPFIICHKNAIMRGLEGCYAVHIKEQDILLIITAIFIPKKNKWKEMDRHAFWWEGDTLNYSGRGIPSKLIDICGQALIPDKNNIDINNIDESSIPITMESGFIKECRSFFKDVVIDNKQGIERVNIKDIWSLSVITFFCHKKEVKRKHLGKAILPEEVYAAMRAHAMNALLTNTELHGSKLADNVSNMACVLVCGKEVKIKCFSPSFLIKYPAENSEIIFYEHQRIPIQKNKPLNILGTCPLIVYVGDMTGTFLEHTAYVIKEASEEIKNMHMGKFRWRTALANGDMRAKTEKSLMLAKMLAENPIMEMMYKADFENCDFLRSFLSSTHFLCSYNLGNIDMTEYVFGEIYEGKTLAQRLGIPEGLLECAAKNKSFGMIKYLKELFSGESREYFMRLDKDSIRKLCDFTTGMADTAYQPDYEKIAAGETMQMLFMMYGYKSWKSYIRQIKKIMDDCKIGMYRNYIGMLAAIGEPVKDADWKLSGEALEKAVKSMCEIYNTTKDGYNWYLNAKIQKRQEELSEFCYEADGYLITYPAGCDDIIREGIELHHCAKEFIDAVANKRTTLLFIREADNPDEPFFTLEIKGRAIWQCHGFNNRNIGSEPGLEAFLQKFCQEKGIKFNTGEKAIGPDVRFQQ